MEINRLLSPSFFIFLIILFALILRLTFFIGFANGDPQDDSIYLNITKQILQKGFCDHNIQKRLVLKEDIINPVYIFPSRLIFNYINTLSFLVFGVNDYAASLFPLICSLLGIYIIYRIGELLFDSRVGLLSAFFLAIIPLDIVYATRITPDVPLALFMTLGIYMFLKGLQRDKGQWLFASGVVVGLGYMVKSTALIGLLIMFLWLVKERNSLNKALYVFSGLVLVLLFEGIYYQLLTDNFFLRLHLIPKVYKFKYSSEWVLNTSTRDLGLIVIEYLRGSLLIHLKTLLNIHHYREGLSYFGFFYYLIFLSFFWVLFKRINHRGYIICWFMLIYLFLEFGPIQIALGLNPLIKYSLIEKQPRYLTIFLAPSVILLSLFLIYVKIPFKRMIAPIVVLILSMSSYQCVSSAHALFRGYTRDIREATVYLQNLPSRKVYIDWLGMDQIYFYSGFKFRNLRNIDAITNEPFSRYNRNAYVIVGGARGAGVLAYEFEKTYNTLLQQVPQDWIVLKTIPGEKDKFRNRNLTIYYVPR